MVFFPLTRARSAFFCSVMSLISSTYPMTWDWESLMTLPEIRASIIERFSDLKLGFKIADISGQADLIPDGKPVRRADKEGGHIVRLQGLHFGIMAEQSDAGQIDVQQTAGRVGQEDSILRFLENQPVFFFGFSEIIGPFLHDFFQVLGIGINAVAHFIKRPGQAPDFILGLDGDSCFRTFAADFQGSLQESFNRTIHKEKDVTDDDGRNEQKQGQVEQDGVNDVAANLLIDADQRGGTSRSPNLRSLGEWA